MISKFTLVTISGGSGKPDVQPWYTPSYEQPALAQAHLIMGVTMTDSETNEPVAVMKRGYLRGCPAQNSETWAVGEILYGLDGGVITHTRPAAPFPQVIVGTVFADEGSNTWTVDVDLRVIPSLGELSGVNRETPVEKDVFIYKGVGYNYWEARQLDHGADIAGLGDDDHTQYLKERLSGGLESEVPGHSHQATASAGQIDHGAAHTAASLLDDDHPLYQRKHGFKRATDGSALVTISYDKTTRKVTVTPTGSTFTFWVDGVQYIKTGAQVAGTAHGTTTGMYYFYYNASGVLSTSAVATPWSILDRAVIPVAAVYWSNTLSDGISYFEAHGAERDIWEHYSHHFTEGTELISGGAMTGITLSTDSDVAITPAIASAIIADEDVVRNLSALSDGGPYHVMYRSGASGEWLWSDAPTFPFLSGTTYPKWNNPNGGGAGVWDLTEMIGTGGGNFMNVYVTAHPANLQVKQWAFIPGQATYATLAEAQAETYQGLQWGVLPFEEVVPMYKLILKCMSTFGGTHKTEIVQKDTIWAKGITITSAAAGSASVHNALAGRSVADAHPASAITNTPAGDIAATTVQAAIDELDTEKAAASHQHVAETDLTTTEMDNTKSLKPDGAGGVEWGVASTVATLDDLTDVNTSGVGGGDVLAFDAGTSTWKPAVASAPGNHETTHEAGGTDALPIEDLGTAEMDSGKVLKPSGAGGVQWGAVAADLADLGDVNIPSPNDNDVLTYDTGTGKWVAAVGAASLALDDLTDVNAPSPSNGEVLTWDAGTNKWIPDTASATVASLDNVGDCNVPAPNNGDVLTWDSTPGEWVAAAPAGSKVIHHQARFAMFSPPIGTNYFPLFEASGTISVKKVRCIHSGSGSLSVNAVKNYRGSASDILSSNLASSAAWVNDSATGGAVALSDGDEIDIKLVSVAGYVEHVVVVVDYEETV